MVFANTVASPSTLGTPLVKGIVGGCSSGIDIGIVSGMGGHSDATVTYKYYAYAIPGEGVEPSTKFAEMIYSGGLEK